MNKLSVLLWIVITVLMPNWLRGKDIDTLRVRVGDNERIVFTAKDLNVFHEIKVDSVLNAVSSQYGGLTSASYRISDTIKFGKDKLPQKKGFVGGTMIIGVSSGFGLVRDILSPQFNAQIGIIKSETNTNAFRGFYMEASTYLFFTRNEEGYNTDVNLFLNGGVSLRRFGKSSFNIGLGVLAKRQNNYFDENTFRFFSEFTTSNKIPLSILPELYITGVFKKVLPGLSVRVSF